MEIIKFILMIIGMFLVTFIPRVIPLILLGNKELPEKVILWLSFIPAAVLSALLAPSILLQNGSLSLKLANTSLVAFFPTLLVAYKTKNIFYTVSGGLVFYLITAALF
ncbi:AzlD domain-containing protein [Halanaerobium congolense]|uniref:Branched-subunit amino acid transport protein n=2 Tax=Halanaerobium congolense TaxID=54121 RepID=A0A4R8GLX4_9FIRM|nr:AzlD domain-containing protein [Halanaerobium congolense]TDX46680.1 branched-subunit amino acid transport protein [Halanaerobium congolense]SDK43265.1 Branched-chain amino acid transport protein [Halanaerobium congolense]SDM89629.1 Branched-chain amino acid transport protein [Halanaerobium congolense]